MDIMHAGSCPRPKKKLGFYTLVRVLHVARSTLGKTKEQGAGYEDSHYIGLILKCNEMRENIRH